MAKKPLAAVKDHPRIEAMSIFFEKITYIFDQLHHLWEQEKMHTKIALSLALFFLFAVVVIELKRQGFLYQPVFAFIPSNHFRAVEAAFTVVLILEVISLIFTIPCSFSRSVGKQFEILALILMRNAFKELSYFPEPISFAGNEQAILYILSDGFGALLIFALLGYYYRVQASLQKNEDRLAPTALFHFVVAKKAVSLILLIIFAYLGITSAYAAIEGIPKADFLHSFYTILILTDILLVLFSQCFQPSFYAIFRNSGFALSTMIIRIALAAPPFFNVALGVAAAVFAILMALTSKALFAKN